MEAFLSIAIVLGILLLVLERTHKLVTLTQWGCDMLSIPLKMLFKQWPLEVRLLRVQWINQADDVYLHTDAVIRVTNLHDSDQRGPLILEVSLDGHTWTQLYPSTSRGADLLEFEIIPRRLSSGISYALRDYLPTRFRVSGLFVRLTTTSGKRRCCSSMRRVTDAAS